MKPRGRVLHFAVSGVLVGGGAVEAGCRPKHNEEYSNTGPMSPPYDDDLHVNPGPDEDPGAEGGAPADDGAAAENGAAPQAEGGPGEPQEVEPAAPDTAPEPQPEPDPSLAPSTNNIRKVEEPARKRKG